MKFEWKWLFQVSALCFSLCLLPALAVRGGGILAQRVPGHTYAVLQVSLPQRARPGTDVAQSRVPLCPGSLCLPLQHQAILWDGKALHFVTLMTLNLRNFTFPQTKLLFKTFKFLFQYWATLTLSISSRFTVIFSYGAIKTVTYFPLLEAP